MATGVFNASSRESTSYPTHAPPLSGVLTSPSANNIGADDQFRRYAGSLNTRTHVNGVYESSLKTILYNIGRVGGPGNARMTVLNDAALRVAVPIATNRIISTEVAGMQKKYTNFTGTFAYMDLSGMTRQLARAIAYYSVYGALSATVIRAGAAIQVRALGTRDDPVSCSETAVFIPRHAAILEAPGAFCALQSAANATGATVFTDVVNVDGNNASVLTEVSDGQLAMGCVHALRIILSMYHANNSGCVAAVDVINGIHDVVSVAGHTDEGSYFRSVLRAGGNVTSYGGIFCSLAEGYVGLPIPTANQASTFTALVDTIALKSAALVSLSDPLSEVRGMLFPSIFETTRGAAFQDAGTTNAGEAADAISISGQIAANSGVFSSNYARLAGWLFGVSAGEDAAARHLETKFGFKAGQDDRHLRYRTVAPWFWIEPTSLFDALPVTAAQGAGFGALGSTTQPLNIDHFEQAQVIASQGASSLVSVVMRSARTSGLIIHLHHHAQDGTANLVPRQFDSKRICMVGGADSAIDDRRQRADDVGTYLWGRGHSVLPAPAEMVYIGTAIGLVKVNYQFDGLGDVTPTHMVSDAEIENGFITTLAGRPQQVGNAELRRVDRMVKRARSVATSALTSARNALRIGFATGGEVWAIGDVEPSVRRAPVPEGIGRTDIERAEVTDPGAIAERRSARNAAVMQDGPQRAQTRLAVVRAGGAGVHPEQGIHAVLQPEARAAVANNVVGAAVRNVDPDVNQTIPAAEQGVAFYEEGAAMLGPQAPGAQ